MEAADEMVLLARVDLALARIEQMVREERLALLRRFAVLAADYPLEGLESAAKERPKSRTPRLPRR